MNEAAHILFRFRTSIWALGLALACFSVKPASAQSTYGQVVGTVTDASKSVVPDVNVTLTEVRTNVQRTTTSKADGNYEFVNVPLGSTGLTWTRGDSRNFLPSHSLWKPGRQ